MVRLTRSYRLVKMHLSLLPVASIQPLKPDKESESEVTLTIQLVPSVLLNKPAKKSESHSDSLRTVFPFEIILSASLQ